MESHEQLAQEIREAFQAIGTAYIAHKTRNVYHKKIGEVSKLMTEAQDKLKTAESLLK